MRVWQPPVVAPKMRVRGLMWMRGSRVVWSPDSPANEGMKPQPNAGNPEARKMYSQLFADDCLGETLRNKNCLEELK